MVCVNKIPVHYNVDILALLFDIFKVILYSFTATVIIMLVFCFIYN